MHRRNAARSALFALACGIGLVSVAAASWDASTTKDSEQKTNVAYRAGGLTEIFPGTLGLQSGFDADSSSWLHEDTGDYGAQWNSGSEGTAALAQTQDDKFVKHTWTKGEEDSPTDLTVESACEVKKAGEVCAPTPGAYVWNCNVSLYEQRPIAKAVDNQGQWEDLGLTSPSPEKDVQAVANGTAVNSGDRKVPSITGSTNGCFQGSSDLYYDTEGVEVTFEFKGSAVGDAANAWILQEWKIWLDCSLKSAISE